MLLFTDDQRIVDEVRQVAAAVEVTLLWYPGDTPLSVVGDLCEQDPIVLIGVDVAQRLVPEAGGDAIVVWAEPLTPDQVYTDGCNYLVPLPSGRDWLVSLLSGALIAAAAEAHLQMAV